MWSKRKCLASGTLLIIILPLIIGASGCLSSSGQLSSRKIAPAPKESQGHLSQYQLRLGTEDELQFYVNVWGQVNKPGLYSVTDGTDLISLISMAGGPTDDAKLTHVVLISGDGRYNGAVRVNLRDYIGSGESGGIPILGPGDTVIVPAKLSHSLFRFSGILSVAALIANVIVTATVR